MKNVSASQYYVSDFPGTETAPVKDIFSSAGYHEPKQSVSGAIIALFALSLVSFGFPPLSSTVALIVGPIALQRYLLLRKRGVHPTGENMLRAAVGLSFLSIAAGLVLAILWVSI